MLAKKTWVAATLGVCFTLWASLAAALPVTVTIHDIEFHDPDVKQDPQSPFYFYQVTNARIGATNFPAESIPHVGVCAVSPETDPAKIQALGGCQNHINPRPDQWSFTADVDPALGTVDVLIQVRNRDASHLDPIDMGPGKPSMLDRGLRLTVDPANGTWWFQNDPTGAMSPITAQSSFIDAGGLGPSDSTIKTARVNFDVSFCGGAGRCADGTSVVCAGTPCTTSGAATPQCNNRPGTFSCATSAAKCVAPPLDVPEEQNNQDDDCDELTDECNASQIGATFPCSGTSGTCPLVAGTRLCTVAEQPPEACVLPTNACQPTCATEILVTNVAELRDAVLNAGLTTDCRDVIILAPGVYDLFDPQRPMVQQQLSIDDSLEIRGQGSSFGCQGVDRAAFMAGSLSPDLGSARCDGDDGEDPGLTVLTTSMPVAPGQFRRVLDIGAQGTAPEVTLRHLTIRGGYSDWRFEGDEGVAIRSQASRLELYNVVVERNVAPAPGAAIDHNGQGPQGSADPSFIMVNSTVRENRCTTGTAGAVGRQGDGGGMRLKGSGAFILRSSIVDNAALRGAGISAYTRLSIFNSTISGNVAGEQGGGIWFASNDTATSNLLELHHTTVTNNVAQWLGGGAPNAAGAGIALRYGQTAQLLGSIVAGNVTCTGEPRIGCGIDADCPTGGTCACESPNPDGTCVDRGGRCQGSGLYPPNLEKTNVCTQLDTDCLAFVEVPGDPKGTFESWGGNVASSGCGVLPSFPLPSGEVAHDVVTALRANRSCSPRTPLQTALDLFCYRGMLQGSNVGGQNSDPAQPTGDVPPPAGAPLMQDFETAYLVGPLADNGGPTPTHAIPAGSLAAGASHTLSDPGDTLDGFPSTVPVCPITDQRGFASALGQRPLQCDAGSYQSTATSALFADDLADELSLLFPDTDGDGIVDAVDTAPEAPSTSFDDARVGGTTSGQIIDAGDQVLRIFDIQPNPLAGLLVVGLSDGGAEPALLHACGGALQLSVAAGEMKLIDCPQQPSACLVATERLVVHDRAEVAVQGVLGGNMSLGQASFGSDVFATGNLALQRTTIVGDAVAAGDVTGTAEADVTGVVSEAAFLRRRNAAARAISVGADAISIGNDESRSLVPGAYAGLTVGDRGVLRLSSGTYTFSAAAFGNDAVIELTGFVRLAIESSLEVGDRVRMLTPAGTVASADLIDWYTNASVVQIGHDVVWTGTLVAPRASVTVHDRASIEGCLAANSVTLGHDSSVFSTGQVALVIAADGVADGCLTDADCAGGKCQAGACVPNGTGACTEANAIDLGTTGQETAVATDGCVRVRDGYPSWWGNRQMKLETTSSGQYPVPFTWTNACTGSSGSGSLNADWQSVLLPGINAGCATLIDLTGSGVGTVNLRYWAQ